MSFFHVYFTNVWSTCQFHYHFSPFSWVIRNYNIFTYIIILKILEFFFYLNVYILHSENSDCQQLHQYQQNEHPPRTQTWPPHMSLEIQVLALDRHNNLVVWNLLMGTLPISDNIYYIVCYMIIIEFILFVCSNIEFPDTNSNPAYNGCDWSIWIIQGLLARPLLFYPSGNRVAVLVHYDMETMFVK